MTSHRKEKASVFKRITRRQWIRSGAVVAAAALLVTGGFVSRDFYKTNVNRTNTSTISAYSATKSDEVDQFQAASRGELRDDIKAGRRGADANTSYVKVVVNGNSRVVLGENFTDVKSVLQQGGITLEPEDTVSPALNTKVNESTTITIERAGSTIETSEKAIPFNTVEKKTDALPEGTKKVQEEGEKGIMEMTNLVTKAGGKIAESNTISSWVKKAPKSKVILIGTGSTQSESTGSTQSESTGSSNSTGSSDASNLGTTVPASEMQKWTHDYLLANGYTEADFSATVYIINHESGWDPTATNPSSGAYGLPQSLPGSKMASAGADWQTNYQTQIKWFLSYCNERYGSVTGAYNYWLSNHSY
ncbi:G5 domain-containing protein [Bifidobacterium catulorum]|uniref:G5 domain-containing protein n=1 Tax=Bifidobacterium catulorum TaxID=1630173 RepID=A0A2U2MUP4_9BIFI|nr:phage tail tip lysozyme [Bifidobacterium catulorum]PWG60555.1 hypothetical protein DF200_01325 [Bifidobacterium catulorum]